MAVVGNNIKKADTKQTMETSVVFNKDTTIDKIVQYMDGGKWSVEYFWLMKTQPEVENIPDISAPDNLSEYTKINNLVLFLDEPIETAVPTEITGVAKINANLIPNRGDSFAATLMGGRKALFTVTDVKKNNYNLNAIYEIIFKLHTFIDQEDEVYRTLIQKSAKELFYTRKKENNDAKLLVREDMFKYLELDTIFGDIVDYYFRVILSNNQFKIMRIPDQQSTIVDLNMEKFLFKILDTQDSRFINDLHRLYVDFDTDLEYTLLDVLLDGDFNKLSSAASKVDLRASNGFFVNPRLMSLGYLGINSYVHVNGTDSTDGLENNGNLFPEILPSLGTLSYILTTHFYGDGVTTTLLEELLTKYLKNEFIDPNELYRLFVDYRQWSKLEVYYFLPLVMLLIKYTRSGLFEEI